MRVYYAYFVLHLLFLNCWPQSITEIKRTTEKTINCDPFFINFFSSFKKLRNQYPLLTQCWSIDHNCSEQY